MKYVAGFLFSEDGQKVLLIQKTKPEWQVGLLNGVGGKIEDFDESTHAAMIREFEEEAGVHVDSWKPVVNLVGKRNEEIIYSVDFFYALDDKIYDTVAMTEEILHIVNKHDLPDNVIFNLRWIIPMCFDECIDKPVEIFDIQGN